MKNCDSCKHYHWYYDYCDKWKCEVDVRSVHDCFDKLGEAMTTSQYDALVQSLTKVKVTLVDANGEFRSTYDIIKDLASVWDELGTMGLMDFVVEVSREINSMTNESEVL